MKWIKVSNKLPENGQIVFAFTNKIVHCKYENKKFYRHIYECQFDRIVSIYYTAITYWMPESNSPLETDDRPTTPLSELEAD